MIQHNLLLKNSVLFVSMFSNWSNFLLIYKYIISTCNLYVLFENMSTLSSFFLCNVCILCRCSFGIKTIKLHRTSSILYNLEIIIIACSQWLRFRWNDPWPHTFVWYFLIFYWTNNNLSIINKCLIQHRNSSIIHVKDLFFITKLYSIYYFFNDLLCFKTQTLIWCRWYQ